MMLGFVTQPNRHLIEILVDFNSLSGFFVEVGDLFQSVIGILVDFNSICFLFQSLPLASIPDRDLS